MKQKQNSCLLINGILQEGKGKQEQYSQQAQGRYEKKTKVLVEKSYKKHWKISGKTNKKTPTFATINEKNATL